MPDLSPYLIFDGNCAEAMRFYERVLGGKLALTNHAESPIADQVPPEAGERILHARLELDGGGVLMASDSMVGQPYEGMKFFSVSLIYPTPAEARRVYDAFAEGGRVTMAFDKTFWSEGFGMLVDRFGTPWMVNGGMTG